MGKVLAQNRVTTGSSLGMLLAHLADPAGHSYINQAVLTSSTPTFNGLNAGGAKITNLAEPTASTDACTKNYTDSVARGLDPKASCICATTAALTLSTGFVNGSVIDGITLTTGDRILIKNQADGIENGIYTVNVSGAPTRALDFATGATVASSYTVIERGTISADFMYLCTNNSGSDVVNTNILVFVIFSVGIIGGDGLTLTGNTMSVNVDTTTIEISADTLRIASGAAGSGLSGGSGSALAVNVDTTTIEISADTLRIAATAAGSGLSGGGGSALAINVGNGLQITSDAVAMINPTVVSTAAAFNTALASGGHIKLIVGSFDLIGLTPTVLSNTIIEGSGDGASGTVLTTSGDDLPNPMLALTSRSNVTIRNLRIDCSNEILNAINLTTCTDILIKNCTFLNCFGSIIQILTSCDRITVNNCRFLTSSDAGSVGIYFPAGTNNNNITLSECYFNDVTYAVICDDNTGIGNINVINSDFVNCDGGISLLATNGVIFQENTVDNCPSVILSTPTTSGDCLVSNNNFINLVSVIHSTYRVIFSDNIFRSNTGNYVQLQGTYVNATGNLFDTALYGLYVVGTPSIDCVVSNNLFDTIANNSIVVSNFSGEVVISGNVIRNGSTSQTESPIYLDTCDNVLITGNFVKVNSSTAVSPINIVSCTNVRAVGNNIEDTRTSAVTSTGSTITVTNLTPTVSCTSGNFLSIFRAGDILTINSVTKTISTVVSNQSMTMTTSYAATATVNLNTITVNFLINPYADRTLITTSSNVSSTIGTLGNADSSSFSRQNYIKLATDGGDFTLTPTNFLNGISYTFDDANDHTILEWNGTKWFNANNQTGNGINLAGSLPAGYYKLETGTYTLVATTITVASNTILEGSGEGTSGTIITTSGNDVPDPMLTLTSQTNVTIRGLRIDCSNEILDAIKITTCTDILIENCTFVNCFGTLIRIDTTSDRITIKNCTFLTNSDTNSTGVYTNTGTSDHINITNCHFNDTTYPIYFDKVVNCLISGNTFLNCDNDIFLNPTELCIFTGNDLKTCNAVRCGTSNTGRYTISDNYFSQMANTGGNIVIGSVKSCVVTNNSFINTGVLSDAIAVDTTTGTAEVSNNLISGCKIGISASLITNCVISGNSIKTSGDRGIVCVTGSNYLISDNVLTDIFTATAAGNNDGGIVLTDMTTAEVTGNTVSMNTATANPPLLITGTTTKTRVYNNNFEDVRSSVIGGTVTTTAASATITGVGTAFLSILRAGDVVLITGDTARTISTVTSNTVATATAVFTVGSGGAVNMTTLTFLLCPYADRTLITTSIANLTNTAATLGDATVESMGRQNYVKLATDGGDLTLTPTNFVNGISYTLDDANDYAILEWNGTKWFNVNNQTGKGINIAGSLPAGHYKLETGTYTLVATTITLASNTVIEGSGDGASGTVITTSGDDIPNPMITMTSLSNVTIRNLRIDASSEILDTILMTGCTDINIQNCTFINGFGNLINLSTACNRITINNCRFLSSSDTASIGINTANAAVNDNLIVTNCQFNDVTKPIYFRYIANCLINNNRFEACDGAMDMSPTELGAFTNNSLDTCFGIVASLGANIDISGNNFLSTTDGAINVTTSAGGNAEISNNIIKSCNYGIHVTTAGNCVISGNSIKTTTLDAITVTGVSNTTITENSCSDIYTSITASSTGGGIKLVGTSDNIVMTGNTLVMSAGVNSHPPIYTSGTLTKLQIVSNGFEDSRNANLSGTTLSTSATTVLTGNGGTNFLSRLRVGDVIIVFGETARTISTITSNTVLDVTVAFSNTATTDIGDATIIFTVIPYVDRTLITTSNTTFNPSGRLGDASVYSTGRINHVGLVTAVSGFTIAPTNFANGTLLEYGAAGQYANFQWSGTDWNLIDNQTTNAPRFSADDPVISATDKLITTTAGTNVASIGAASNPKVFRRDEEIILTFTVTVTPTAGATATDFTFTLPFRTTNNGAVTDVNVQVTGYDSGSDVALENSFGRAVTAAKTAKVFFTSNGVAADNIINVVAIYSAN